MTVPVETFRTFGASEISKVFGHRFEAFKEKPESPPPLVDSNEMVFADDCDLLRATNDISDVFDQAEQPFLLGPISYEEYLEMFKRQGGRR
ncbi:MAG: hypothetical protein ACK4MQ_03035 [Hyphomonas sp.]